MMEILLISKQSLVGINKFYTNDGVYKNFFLLDELFTSEPSQVPLEENKRKESRKIQIVPPQSSQQQKKAERTRITFNTEDANRKKSVLERLGKRRSDDAISETESFLKSTRRKLDSEEEEEKKVGRIVSFFLSKSFFLYCCILECYESFGSDVKSVGAGETARRGTAASKGSA